MTAVPAVPYRGIQPFRYADHAIFFARERETRQLARLVDVYRGVFLYGDSGNGKSSLVNAGLLPQARELGFEPVRVRVQPRAGEELVIEQIAVRDDHSELLPCVLAPDDDSARVVLSIGQFEARVRHAAREGQPLIVFDQFEEILTLFDEDDTSRHALARMIVGLLREELPVKLLFAFREDYLGRVKQLLGARPELVDQALRLGPPPADVLGTIIRGPFERHPGHFERELDVPLAGRLQSALAERFGAGEVSLSEVQTVCLRLWHSADPAALLADKGVRGLLEDELGEALAAFPTDLRAAAIALLSQMVTPAGTRNVVSAEDLRQRVRDDDAKIASALLDEALERLERESKLVRRERRRDIYLYEITSEFLVPWISRRREELLLAQERRRGRRRLRIVALVTGTLLILAAAVAVIVLSQRAETQRQATNATSLALSASSAEPLTTRPDISLALAFEALRTAPRAEATAAVIRALLAARRSRLRTVLTLNGAVQGVAFSPDGKIFAAGGEDKTVRLWDARTRKQLGQLTGHTDTVNAVAFSPDGQTIVTGSDDSTVRLWDARTRKPLARLTGHTDSVDAVAFSPDSTTVASGGSDTTVRLWDARTRKPLARLTGHTDVVVAVAFSPDGKTLATGSIDRTLRLWDALKRKPLARLTGHKDVVNAVAFSPDGKALATGSADATVRLWDARTRQPLARLTGQRYAVHVVAFSPDGVTLASGGEGDTLLWNVRTREPRARLAGHTSAVNAIAFSPDGGTLATGSFDHTVRLWDARTRRPPDHLIGHTDAVSAVAFSPDGKTLATSSDDMSVRLWDTRTRRRPDRLTGHTDIVSAVAFSPDGKTLATGSADKTVRLWDARTRKPLGRLTGHTDTVTAVAFSPNGETLVSGSVDSTLRLWDARTRKPLGRFTGHSDSVTAVAFSPDGETLASGSDEGQAPVPGSDDYTVRLWDARTRKQLGQLAGHTDTVSAVAFSRDGKTLASSSFDKTVRLWDAQTRKPLGRLTGHTDAVLAVAFSPHNETLASGGFDNRVRLWNTRTHKSLGHLTGHSSAVSAIAFHPNGRTVAAGSVDSTVRLWHEVLWHDTRELHTSVCDILLTGMRRSEWLQHAPGISYHRSCP